MNVYKRRVDDYTADISKLDKDIGKVSSQRLATFLISIALILYLANARLNFLLILAIPTCLVIFGLIIVRYNKIFSERSRLVFLKAVNEQEILRLANKLSDFPSGQSYIKSDHDYVSDIDIFGAHSLFQLLNRATTESGRVLLADWLSVAASKEVIIERQHAVNELVPKLEWRHDFQAAGMRFDTEKSDHNKLLAWIAKPVVLLPKKFKYLSVAIILGIFSTAAVVNFVHGLLYHLDNFSLRYIIPLIVILIVNSRVLKRFKVLSEEIIQSTQYNLKILGSYESLIAKVETEQFNSGLLRQLQSSFLAGNYSASKEIGKLKKLLEIFQQRGTKASIGRNDFYKIFNLLWLFDIYFIILTEKWKLKNQSYLRLWIASVSEFEVLNSIAGFSYSNPLYAFPQIEDKPYVINFVELGHPLIHREQRVCNSFNLSGQGEIVMITGSNMAGKSTFLRTVGVNLVLALMGAPCCASVGSVSQIMIFTSMRTQDNLEEGVSSFYAELKRIERLLKLIESGQSIFFMLDEMFKGTNSQDRYKGGASLIKQLGDLNAFGIISTHDLELANLVRNQSKITNLSFNSTIKGAEILFNYQLANGICTDFNASELMRRSGIKILPDL